jgi:hypothetical protein
MTGDMTSTPIIVESHHQVLSSWAEFRRKLRHPPRLITLDHHTDTSKPFRNLLRKLYGPKSRQAEAQRSQWIAELDYRDPATVEKAMERLGNDEHILAAIQSQIISSAFVIAHNALNTDIATYIEHKVMCQSVDRKLGSTKLDRTDLDQVLESKFLGEVFAAFNQQLQEIGEPRLDEAPYILDIDLDYFNTQRSICPKDPLKIQALAREAGLITIATEPEYVKTCALDAGLSSEGLLQALRGLLSTQPSI